MFSILTQRDNECLAAEAGVKYLIQELGAGLAQPFILFTHSPNKRLLSA